MTTVTIGISSTEETKARMQRAFRGESQGAFVSFASAELLWKVITPKRWERLRALTGAGPAAIREIARRVSRDAKSVHGDIQALLKAGILDRAPDGRILFPYGEIHVDFVLRAARHCYPRPRRKRDRQRPLLANQQNGSDLMPVLPSATTPASGRHVGEDYGLKQETHQNNTIAVRSAGRICWLESRLAQVEFVDQRLKKPHPGSISLETFQYALSSGSAAVDPD